MWVGRWRVRYISGDNTGEYDNGDNCGDGDDRHTVHDTSYLHFSAYIVSPYCGRSVVSTA